MEPIKIFIVDDHAIVRDGINSMLQSQSDLEIVGQAESGESAIEQLEHIKPDIILMDIILMDIMMTGMDGIEATRRIKQSFQNLKSSSCR